MQVIELVDLPQFPNTEIVYRLGAKNPDTHYYNERTDRNIGWITLEEQRMLQGRVIGIAGCGGMGGMLASTFFRLGVGEVRIADCEVFDVSNINRQFGAKRSTVGKSKAFVTAKETRAVTDDGTLVVYPQGINAETVEHFLDGCDLICDEIEFWAVGARMLLHERARARNIPIFCADTVGFVSHVFLFTHKSMTVGDMLRMTLPEAEELQGLLASRKASSDQIELVYEAVARFAAPELKSYSETLMAGSVEGMRKRFLEEGKAPIIATNPPLAAGFLADRVLLELLRRYSSVERSVIQMPTTPSYLSFDAAVMEAKVVYRTTCP